MCFTPPDPDYLTPLLAVITGTVIGVISEPIRTWLFRPELRLKFDPARDVTPSPTFVGYPGGPQRRSQGRYLRVQAINESHRIAKGCRAFLVDVEQADDQGSFRPAGYLDSLRLKWASQSPGDELRAIDLPRGVALFVEVLSADESSPEVFAMHTPFVPAIYSKLFDEKPKTLRLTVLVTGDNARPAKTRVIFEWRGSWDTFSGQRDAL
jgi:hypothetical protein